MPGPGLKIAELFILHQIHLRKAFNPNVIGTAMVRGDIVADGMTSRTEYQRNLILGQTIAGVEYCAPVPDFKSDMKQPFLFSPDKIQDMMIDATAEKRKTIPNPVGYAKPENVTIKLRQFLRVVHPIGHVPKFHRRDADRLSLVG